MRIIFSEQYTWIFVSDDATSSNSNGFVAEFKRSLQLMRESDNLNSGGFHQKVPIPTPFDKHNNIL